jgi:hypothetical protein
MSHLASTQCVRRLVALLATLSAFLAFAAGAPDVVVDLQDPANDAYGPGTYSAPQDSDLQGTHFDLRRFVARVERDDVVLEVTLGEAIRAPASVWRTNTTPIPLNNGIYLQNIDIYVDTDPASPGISTCIPGRRVAFADGRGWKRAIVLSPQPSATASVVESALKSNASAVAFPGPLTNRGKTVIARVPIAFFGAKPTKDWGWSVQLSGAAWERNFSVANRLTGTAQPDALTMPVSTTAERWEFGGAPLGRFHPQVIDVIVPPGLDQKMMLAGFNNETGTLAAVPFVYPRPPPPLRPVETPVEGPPPSPPTEGTSELAKDPVLTRGWTVVDVSEDIVSIRGTTTGLAPMMFGQVLDGTGHVVARVVVMQVLSSGIVASAIDHRELIGRGAEVRFDIKTDIKNNTKSKE